MDCSGPNWTINSSFSPPLPRRWDCRFQPNESTYVTNGSAIYGSSASSYSNHHHSVSDGALSYYGSPSENLQAPRWTPPVQRYDLGEFSTPAGGARPEALILSRNNERQQITRRVPSMSSSVGSPFTLSESSQWASSSKLPIFFPPCNSFGRRSFMSKPVYPLVYRNPISDAKIYSTATTPGGTTFSPDLKFHTDVEVFPDLNTSFSRREEFRWSNASSSYDFGSDADTIDNMELPYTNCNSNRNSAVYQKCALCERPLSQKSPWSSHRIVRSNDMPVSGVLPCRHVFHADCLEETTPDALVHEPPCPVCQKEITGEGSASFSETQQIGANVYVVSDSRAGSSSCPNPGSNDVRRNLSLPSPWRGDLLLTSHLKKRFSLKGKTGKDLFGAKMFW